MPFGNCFGRRSIWAAVIVAAFLLATGDAKAVLISVAGPNSSMGVAAGIIPAPAHALDDVATNMAMQGFNEALGVVTTVGHNTDGGGVIPAGTRVDSHMIFLNSPDAGDISHFSVIWMFANPIIGIMSDRNGNLEADSTFELGNPTTNYTLPFGGSGPAAPFQARGLESNNGTGLGGDGYQLLAPNVLRVGMDTSEPGDWIRVVTLSGVSLPEPATIALFGVGLVGLGLAAKRRRAAAAFKTSRGPGRG